MREEKRETGEDIKERVEKLTTINFSITKCPIKVYKRFVEFCKGETNDNYSFGLKLMLDGMDGNVKESLLFQQYIEIKERLDKIEIVLNDKDDVEEKSDVKTFGNKGVKNKETKEMDKNE